MKREILFRGKRVDNGEWVEGYAVRGFKGDWFIHHINEHSYVPVDPETVGQYTGHKDDVKEERIFEGDIVQSECGTFEVRYNSSRCALMLFNINLDMFQMNAEPYIGRHVWKVEIIGNIHDKDQHEGDECHAKERKFRAQTG